MEHSAWSRGRGAWRIEQSVQGMELGAWGVALDAEGRGHGA